MENTRIDNIRIDTASELVPAPGCPICRQTMRLAGVEWETEVRDVYTFYCRVCDHSETKRLELH